DALARERLTPPDPRMLSRIDEARAELQRAAALEFAGRFEDALGHTTTALAEADDLGYGPLRAEVLARRGALLDRTSRSPEAIETLYDAAATATANRHHAAAARAWIELVYALGRHEQRFGEARVANAQAEAELVALGGDDNLDAARLTNLGTLEFGEGRIDDALAHYRDALDLRARLEQPLRQADVLFNIANVELMQGKYDDAGTHLRECLDLWQAVVGTAHPDTLDVIHSLGVLHGHAERYEESREQLELALRLRTELLGADSREAAASASALGRAYVGLGRFDEGIALMERSLASYERLYAPDHAHVGGQRAHLAEALWAAGRHDEARREIARAIEIETAALGEDHPTVASSMRLHAHFELAAGHRTIAEKILRRSLVTLEKAWGPDNIDVVATRDMLAAALRGETFE
ncbi:MAG TPA: tetratricopeptide repeat protein, partial [Nannocystaceae bacterium]|nr:tetratricopeptide repeat protein [Nannocystaceae bacterium]